MSGFMTLVVLFGTVVEFAAGDHIGHNSRLRLRNALPSNRFARTVFRNPSTHLEANAQLTPASFGWAARARFGRRGIQTPVFPVHRVESQFDVFGQAFVPNLGADAVQNTGSTMVNNILMNNDFSNILGDISTSLNRQPDQVSSEINPVFVDNQNVNINIASNGWGDFPTVNSLDVVPPTMATAKDGRDVLRMQLDGIARSPSTRTSRENEILKQHLVHLNSLQQQHSPDQHLTLQVQLNYIRNISEIEIQREVLKMFVKDLVEKSGVLIEGANAAADISTAGDLLNLINYITENVLQKVPNTVKAKHENALTVRDLVINKNELIGGQTLDSNTNQIVGNIAIPNSQGSRESLSIFGEQQTGSKTNLVEFGTLHGVSSGSLGRLLSYDGRSRQNPVRDQTNVEPVTATVNKIGRVGMSIFGGPLDVSNQGKPAVSKDPATVGVPTDKQPANQVSPKREPLGGNDAYWTHLRSGLMDVLCSLCQQSGNQPCIRRYCNSA